MVIMKILIFLFKSSIFTSKLSDNKFSRKIFFLSLYHMEGFQALLRAWQILSLTLEGWVLFSILWCTVFSWLRNHFTIIFDVFLCQPGVKNWLEVLGLEPTTPYPQPDAMTVRVCLLELCLLQPFGFIDSCE